MSRAFSRLVADLVGDERALVEDAPELFEEHRRVEEREVVGGEQTDPAELLELLPRRCRIRLEERAGLAAEIFLLLREREVHSCQRLLGRPSTRSPTMLRRISLVPASIVLPRERSCWYCQ